MPGFPVLTIFKRFRALAGACLLAPCLAFAQSPLDSEIAQIRELVRFVPEKALVQLQQMEPLARSAPPLTRAEFLAQLSLTHRSLGKHDVALALANELYDFGRAQDNKIIIAKGLLTKAYIRSAMNERQVSHELAFEAEKLASATSDMVLRVQSTITAGQSYAEQGNYPVALIRLQSAVELAQKVESDKVPLASALNALTLFYTQVREQFGLPIGRFDAIAGVIAGMACELYATDAARRYTAAVLDHGEQPSVASAILKVHLTEAGRRAVNHGMDILGGKGIIQGPSNLLSVAYRGAPIAITVEGANILTRSLIIFGQGAVRCHPYVMKEMQAVRDDDAQALGEALIGHGGHVLRNVWHSIAGAPLLGTPPAGLEKEARLIARLSSQYALTCDLAMGLLGGKLKRMELLSARLGDVLAHLYMASACAWRYAMEKDGDMLPVARAAIRVQLDQAGNALEALYANFPSPLRRVVGAMVLNRSTRLAPLRDVQLLDLARLLRTHHALMRRLCPDLATPAGGGLRDLMDALALAERLGEETVSLNKAVRRSQSMERAAQADRKRSCRERV